MSLRHSRYWLVRQECDGSHPKEGATSVTSASISNSVKAAGIADYTTVFVEAPDTPTDGLVRKL